MSESFSNTNPSAYTTSAIQPAGTSTTQVAANNQAPAEQTTVPVGEGDNSVANTTIEKNISQAHFDSEIQPISSAYAQKYLSGLNNQPTFKHYEEANADVSFGALDPGRLKGGDKVKARQSGFKAFGVSGYGFLGQFKTNAYYAELRATAEALSTDNHTVKSTTFGFIKYPTNENGDIIPNKGIEVDKNGKEIPFTDKFPDLTPSLHVLSLS